jgi:HAD superfamily hydrolase (TIGR01509 family)
MKLSFNNEHCFAGLSSAQNFLEGYRRIMTFAALIWDLDGTLVDSEPAHYAARSDALTELDLAVPEDFHARMLGVNDLDIHAALVAEVGATIPADEWRALKLSHYRRHTASVRPRTEVAQVAEHWSRQGILSAIVTNSTREEVTIAMEATGLDWAFKTTVSFSDVTKGKPDPEGYLLAAERLGVSPQKCLVTEDTTTGAAAGCAAGMTVIYHPQAPVEDSSAAAPGAVYLPPDGSLSEMLNQAMEKGVLA